MLAFMAEVVNGPKGEARSPGRSPAARPSPAGRAAAYAVKEMARKELRRSGASPQHARELDAPGAKELVSLAKDLSRQAPGTAHSMAALGGASRQSAPVGAGGGGGGGGSGGVRCARALATAPPNKVGGIRVEVAAGSAPAGAAAVRSPPGAVASAGAVAVASTGAVVGSGARYAAAAAAAVSGNRNRVRGRFNGPPDVGLSAARLGIHDALRKAEERR